MGEVGTLGRSATQDYASAQGICRHRPLARAAGIPGHLSLQRSRSGVSREEKTSRWLDCAIAEAGTRASAAKRLRHAIRQGLRRDVAGVGTGGIDGRLKSQDLSLKIQRLRSQVSKLRSQDSKPQVSSLTNS